MLDGSAEGQPQQAARQRGENEEAAEEGRLNARAARLGVEERAGRARAHEPGFRVDPLEDRRAHVTDRIRSRDRFDAAGGRRNLPRQPEQDRGAAPVQGLQQQRMLEDESAETERDEDALGP